MLRKLFAAVALAGFASVATAQETLVVYWTKGFYPQEDKALDDMVAKFEKKTGVKVELSQPRDHLELAGERIDMERGARLSGSRFAYLRGDLVMLELALVRWALEKLRGHGFEPVTSFGVTTRGQGTLLQ